MKANRKFKNEEAVSAVIGVILMVAITVAIAATVYVYVSGMLGGGPTGTASVSLIATPGTGLCSITVGSITEAGVDWADVNIVFHDLTLGTAVANGTTGNWTYPGGGAIQGGDLISIAGLTLDHQYRCTMVDKTTGGTMGTSTWYQAS